LGKSKFIIFPLLILIPLSVSYLIYHYAIADSFNREFNQIVKPYIFDIGKWEVLTISTEIDSLFNDETDISDQDIEVVKAYFSNLETIRWLEYEIAAINSGTWQGDLAASGEELDELLQQNEAIVDTVELVLEKQIREALIDQGILNPWQDSTDYQGHFPPVNFILDKPPCVLVISPRDRIERMRETTLFPGISEEDMESVETQITQLGYSALVVEVGGMATYPYYVTDRASLEYVINTITEEWLHQYLAFKPLGFLYILDLAGLRRNADIVTMNETLAGMVSKEIGAIIYEKYYSSGEPENTQPPEDESAFDFGKEMREIRRTVDDYLARGEIEQAEEYMEQKRLYLAENGYYIRKLNQAYFAFHGAYADSPTSINPIGTEMSKLREQSISLKGFLETVAGMTTRQELVESIK
jgi:hypothetical protein